MQCPLCKTEMRIGASKTVVEGDNSPDTPTKVYIEQTMICRCPQCENFGKVVQTERSYLVGSGE